MKNFLITILLFCSLIGFSQKKELRSAQKLLDQSFYNEAIDVLFKIKEVIPNSDQKYQAQYYYLLGWANKSDSKFAEAVSFLKMSIENDKSNKYKEKVNLLIDEIENELIRLAVEDNKSENFILASEKLYDAYLINPENERNIDYLYFAASSSVNAKDFEVALGYYLSLKDMGYTGEVTEYFLTTIESKIEEKYGEREYNLLKSSKQYTNPRIDQTESRLPEIVKNIALIYVELGENEKAISAVKEAREVNPEDFNLLLSEADLYIKLGDRIKFKDLMQEAVIKNPNNAILYYNLGVIYGEQGEREEAIAYYKKSLELNPNYPDSYLNLVALILEGESALVEKMNQLATSTKRSDYDKYDKLKSEREALYASCIPYLEKLIEVDPSNIEALKTAKNIYYTVGENDLFKLMTAKIQELEN